MARATRTDTLRTICDLLLLAKPREHRSFPGPARMLEIAEVAYVLQADRFSEPEVFERLAQVYGTPPPPEFLDSRLNEYLTEHLRTFDPAYLDLATSDGLLGVVLQVAYLWAELHAGQVSRCGWPHTDQLGEAWDIDGSTGIIRTVPKGGRMKPFPKFTRTLADIDILLTEYHGQTASRCAPVEGAGGSGRRAAPLQYGCQILADDDGIERDCPRERRPGHRLCRHHEKLIGGAERMNWCGNRTSTLSAMINIRRIVMSEGSTKPEGVKVPDGAPEDAMLEIAELAHVLKADGFPEPEIFKRIGRVHQPEPQFHSFPLGGDPLFYYLRDYLAARFPAYLPLSWTMFMTTVTVASLWAELFAEQLTASSWPPADMLSKPWGFRRYAGYAGVMNSSKPEEFAKLAGNLGDLDVLIAEASTHPYGSESARAYRRMKARAVPGDILHGYSTGASGPKAGMGTAGIALVRDGRTIDHVETRYGA